MATSIRLAQTNDARGLAEVRVRGWQVGYEGIVDAGFLQAMSIDQNESRWREIINERGEQILVAIVDERVAAFASSGPYRLAPEDDELVDPTRTGELYGFYTHPDYWGTGVATELHAVAVDGLRTAGWQTLKLWVLEENARARRFYEREGWTADGERKRLTIANEPFELRYEQVSQRD